MTTTENIALTVGACYEGSAVPFALVMKYAGVTADDITRAVSTGVVRIVRRVIGPGGQLLQGRNSLFLVPDWAD